jgi:hypothetical protein
MGRKKKYLTDEAKRIAQNEYAMSYYEKNKDIIKEKARKKYELQKDLRSNSRSSETRE